MQKSVNLKQLILPVLIILSMVIMTLITTLPVNAIDCDGVATAEDCEVQTISTTTGRYRTVISGDGAYPSDTIASITAFDVPACLSGPATIHTATLSWAIRDGNLAFWEDGIDIDRDGGTPVTATHDIRYKTSIFGNNYSSYHTDITATGIVSSGTHNYNIAGLDTSGGGATTNQWGFGLHVIYECPEFPIVTTVYKNGQDMHWSGWPAFPWALDRSELICESFAATATIRTATLEMHLLGSATGNRQADIWFKTGTGAAPAPGAYDLLSDVNTPDNGGAVLARAVLGGEPEWDVYQGGITIPAGDEYACVQVDSSFAAGTHPSNPSYKGASMFSGATWFSIEQPVVEDLSLGDFVWEDTNNNGLLDGVEAGICGVDVHLYIDANSDGQYTTGADGMIPAATTTTGCGGALGEYEFTGLAADDYLVVIPTAEFGPGGDLEGFVSSTGTNGSGSGPYESAPDPDNDINNDDNGTFQVTNGAVSSAITLTVGGEPITDGDADTDTNFSLDLGFYRPLRIGNQIFHDRDNDALFEIGEDGIEAVVIELYLDINSDGSLQPGGADGAAVATTLTNSDGRFWFDNLIEGLYYVAIPEAGNTSVTIGAVSGLDLNDLVNSSGAGLADLDSGASEPSSDLNADHDDNGLDAGNFTIPAGYITNAQRLTLNYAVESTAEAAPGGTPGDDETEANAQPGAPFSADADSNLTVDIGFTGLPDIALTKSVDKDGDASFSQSEIILRPAVLGNPDPTAFQYQFVVENQSALTDATGVIMTDILPPGVTAISVGSVTTGSVTTPLPITGAAGAGSSLVWNIGAHSAGTTHTLVLNVELASANVADFIAGFDGGSATQNVAEITAMAEEDLDSIPSNASTADYGGPSTGFDPATSEDDEDDARVSIPPAAGNFVWLDTDADGVQDVGEPGITGVTVRIYQDIGAPGPDGGDTLIATAITPASGEYWFGDLLSATNYYINFDLASVPASLTPTSIDVGGDTTDSDGDITTGNTAVFTLAAGEINETLDMGFTTKPSLGDTVWLDADNDGIQDVGEPGISGVTVNIYEDDDGSAGFSVGDTLIDTQVTDGSGNYIFSNLTMSIDYYVEFDHSTAPTGFVPSTQDVGSDTTDSDGDVTTGVTAAHNLGLAETRLTVDQGYVPQYSIGNRIWLDSGSASTNDGIQNAGESGMSGVTVKLLDSSGTPVDDPTILGVQDYDVATDANGYYRFDQLKAGDYIVGVLQSSLPTNVISSAGQSTTSTPDQRDHGADVVVSGTYRSSVITLGESSQPTDETDFGAGSGAESSYGDVRSNLAIDFGFAEVSDVTVDKNVVPGTFTIGETSTVTFTVNVTNSGPTDVAGISLIDNTAIGMYFTGWTCSITTAGVGGLTESCQNASGSGSISETVTLNVGGIATYVVTADIGASTIAAITNTATVSLPATIVQDPSSNDPDVDIATVLPQQKNPSINLDKALYEGHDLGVQCNSAAAVDELIIVDKDKSLKDITYCFTMLNDGDTYLDSFTMVDAVLGITEANMTLLPSDAVPLAPGDTLTYYYETATDTSVNNVATVSARPVTPGGTATGQPNVESTDPTAVLIYVSDPPLGIKTGVFDGKDVITWQMVWINDSILDADGVVISDEVPEGTTYDGNLGCSPQGATTVASCVYEDPSVTYPRGRILAVADIAADNGATTVDAAVNELVITFNVLLDNASEDRTYENQGILQWDADKDGNYDFTVLTDDPLPSGDEDPSTISVALAETGAGIRYDLIAGASILALVLLQWRTQGKKYSAK